MFLRHARNSHGKVTKFVFITFMSASPFLTFVNYFFKKNFSFFPMTFFVFCFRTILLVIFLFSPPGGEIGHLFPYFLINIAHIYPATVAAPEYIVI